MALFVDGPENDAAEGTGAPGPGESGRLVTLAVLAGATTRIRLQTEVLLVPLRQTALLAKQVAWAAGLFAAVARSWVEHGRSGAPRNVGQVNVALGPEAVVADARTAMADYYAFTGDASRMTAGLCTTRATVRDTISAFADLGADEVVLYCWATDPTQLDRLADLTA